MIFSVISRDSGCNARSGRIATRRGEIETPVFMPVGTAGAVKALTPQTLEQLGAQIILGNTYHLYLRPGVDIIRQFGSLHGFSGWKRPILTDSGGFQIFSINANFSVREQGVRFKSHIDGGMHELSPEDVVEIQNAYDSDIQMVLDNFAGHPATREQDEKALKITGLWAKRARERFLETNQNQNAQFGIVQGGLHTDLRRRSVAELTAIGFDGYAVGGLSVGESRNEFEDIVRFTVPLLPPDTPRYLMGSGSPEEILAAVESGVDMFDCVLPTRNARNGCLFTEQGKISIKNERYKTDPAPLDPNCSCYTCQNFSRAFLRHLYIAGEINSSILNSIHNIHFYLDFMTKIRYSIKLSQFTRFKNQFLETFKQGV